MMRIGLLFWLAVPTLAFGIAPSDRWVPARWDGGPAEVARRARSGQLPDQPAQLRDVLLKWYDPSTLSLLEGTPVNCLLVTFVADVDPDVEKEQHRLIQGFVRTAHERNFAVLGIVHPGREPGAVAAAAEKAGLDGLVLEAKFPEGSLFAEKLRKELREKNVSAPVLTIEKDPAAARRPETVLPIVEGVRPDARDLADMGIRAGPSAEPWIESNIWLVRSFRLKNAWRPVWISQVPKASSPGDYLRCIADASIAGGHWIATLDDTLRAGLFRKDAAALETWKSVVRYLAFAMNHSEWRDYPPYGYVGLLLDATGNNPEFSDEYLNLVARRHIPYRVILRSDLGPASLAGLRVVLAADIDTPTGAERALFQKFAENGGVVIAGPKWGTHPVDGDSATVPAGKGRFVIYKDNPPDPETVARDMVDQLEPEDTGLTVFNVPSVLQYVSNEGAGKRVLVQLLNYATTPFNGKITIRLKGVFRRARLLTPEGEPLDLNPRPMPNDWTEFALPKLAVWGAVILD